MATTASLSLLLIIVISSWSTLTSVNPSFSNQRNTSQCVCFDWYRGETPFVFPVKVSSIIRSQTLHDLAHIALGGFQNKLKMIGQQVISVEAITKLFSVTLQKLQIVFSVFTFPEKGLAVIATDDKVVYRPYKLGSKFSCHLFYLSN